nr:unnamed protein product [Haemonchus contortus]
MCAAFWWCTSYFALVHDVLDIFKQATAQEFDFTKNTSVSKKNKECAGWLKHPECIGSVSKNLSIYYCR